MIPWRDYPIKLTDWLIDLYKNDLEPTRDTLRKKIQEIYNEFKKRENNED